MTEDLHNDIIRELKNRGVFASAAGYNIDITITIETMELCLRCELGSTFPYEFPKIYLSPESKEKIKPMPHINTDNSICVFDEGIALPNFNNPVQLAVETVLKAIEILSKGIRKENQWDFLDEFNAYWNTKAIMKANSFISDLKRSHIFYYCFQEGKNDPLLIADSADDLKRIYKSINIQDLPLKKIRSGLLIPIDKGLESSIPKTDQDIVCLIQNHSTFSKDYDKFMQSHIDKTALILFAQQSERGTILSGWMHLGPGIPKGFRQGHVNLSVAFSLSKKKGFALSVENCSQGRLFTRGSDGSKVTWNNVAIIGCGSLGSSLADMLLYSGTSSYILNDNQLLQYENIARHSRGYSYKGIFKVDAIKFGLEKHNPNIICQCFKENAHIFIEENADKLNSCDIIFVAVASLPVEHHICKLVNDGIITSPVVLLWIEPYAIGGHAIVIKKRQNLFDELFDESTFDFLFSLVANSKELLKREAGCQSTYMPYSGFYLQMFVAGIVEKIMKEILDKKGNYLITWCGRLSSAKDYGIQLSTFAKPKPDFSFFERRID